MTPCRKMHYIFHSKFRWGDLNIRFRYRSPVDLKLDYCGSI